MWILYIIIAGFVAGALARLALPGPDPMPWYATLALGIAGAFVGGILFAIPARAVFGTVSEVIAPILGAMLLLYLYRRFVQKRPLTGPAARRRPL